MRYEQAAGDDGAASGVGTTGGQTEPDSTTVPTDTTLTGAGGDTTPPATGDATGDTIPEGDTETGGHAAPDAYADFAMPEGVEVDSALLTEAAPLFKELGLNQEQAQKLVDFQAKQVKASSEGSVDAFNRLMNDWQTESKNDSEFGGDKFEENVGIARAAIDKFGTPGLKQLLEEHGVGNHPEVIRFMVKVGKLTVEDVPGGSTAATSKTQDRLSILYPTDKT